MQGRNDCFRYYYLLRQYMITALNQAMLFVCNWKIWQLDHALLICSQSGLVCLFIGKRPVLCGDVWVFNEWSGLLSLRAKSIRRMRLIETRLTIASFLPSCFIHTRQSPASFFPCFNQDTRLPTSFVPSFPLSVSLPDLVYFAVPDQHISLSVPSISTNWSIHPPFMDICNWVAESKPNQANL